MSIPKGTAGIVTVGVCTGLSVGFWLLGDRIASLLFAATAAAAAVMFRAALTLRDEGTCWLCGHSGTVNTLGLCGQCHHSYARSD